MAAIPMDNPYCSCKLTRVRSAVGRRQDREGRLREDVCRGRLRGRAAAAAGEKRPGRNGRAAGEERNRSRERAAQGNRSGGCHTDWCRGVVGVRSHVGGGCGARPSVLTNKYFGPEKSSATLRTRFQCQWSSRVFYSRRVIYSRQIYLL